MVSQQTYQKLHEQLYSYLIVLVFVLVPIIQEGPRLICSLRRYQQFSEQM